MTKRLGRRLLSRIGLFKASSTPDGKTLKLNDYRVDTTLIPWSSSTLLQQLQTSIPHTSFCRLQRRGGAAAR